MDLKTLRGLVQDAGALADDPMFDPAFCRKHARGVFGRLLPPVWVYLLHRPGERPRAHPLFDAAWYLDTYADVAKAGVDPLLHYIRAGRSEQRWPNALFDPGWYRRRVGAGLAPNEDPVQHYMRHGGRAADPSAEFDSLAYLRDNPQAAQSGLSPLAHYLSLDPAARRAAGASAIRPMAGPPVTDAEMVCLKAPTAPGRAAIFVAHAPDGRLKPYVAPYLQSLHQAGIGVTLVVAADQAFTEDGPSLLELLDGLYVRGNRGWDFAAWAHVLRLNPRLYDSETLFWLNDSVIGPMTPQALYDVLKAIDATSAAVVGLTDNLHYGARPHLQSYFLALKSEALRTSAFRAFVEHITNLEDKSDVIRLYELTFSEQMQAAGLGTAALFPLGADGLDRTCFHWKELLAAGFPFIKASILTRPAPGADTRGWRDVLAAHGYEIDRLEDWLVRQGV